MELHADFITDVNAIRNKQKYMTKGSDEYNGLEAELMRLNKEYEDDYYEIWEFMF
jgi:hypothetical protein